MMVDKKISQEGKTKLNMPDYLNPFIPSGLRKSYNLKLQLLNAGLFKYV